MNNKHQFIAVLATTAIALGLNSCSDDFLKEKKNYGNFNQTTAYSNFNGAQERVNNLYYWMLPTADGGDGNGTNRPNDWTPVGNPDKWSKSTEEYGGFSIFVDPEEEITYNFNSDGKPNFDFFYVANDVYSPWGHIRNCNDVIENVQKADFTDEEKNMLLGQAYFFRAYMYYHLVTIYGGVPIIDYVQDPILGKDGDGGDLIVARQTTRDCVNFICQDLERAASMLPARWQNEAQDFGRVTSGLAQAFLGKMKLYWASPVFNRADEQTRWEEAYTANKQALDLLRTGGFGPAVERTMVPTGQGFGMTTLVATAPLRRRFSSPCTIPRTTFLASPTTASTTVGSTAYARATPMVEVDTHRRRKSWTSSPWPTD